MTRLSAFLAATALVAMASPAAAAVNVTLSNQGQPFALPDGQELIATFDDANNPTQVFVDGVTLTLIGATVGVNEGGSGYSGTLPNDDTHYLTVPGGATATFESLRLMSSFSLFMGSPDTYNQIEFFGDNGYHEVLSGADMFLGDTNQDWGWGKRVNFDFGGYNVNKIVLSSSGNSFEVDTAAGAFAAGVPEPATWALMIGGFMATGVMLRRRRANLSLA
ncbi:PEPxxWA-CTERM sorting domain-containing protein [Phenylobacterium sp.]|uniref:Npun_F0296 family exosortase-dependent surface protein n=1 Tax=Phenylobacterium sp. TaxID=1871053 RepID=UPI0025E18334|nr:PEPxxWA-CTERM sorting domain-containing protein [Phenylobacterium sp.]MBX3482089.1 PEPxxWA-CTERM sorting domain-containing protein [Phenylobacterium sp.]MCW5760739.1 PEPxxWA-CTERM sorting domain-containing protein [Phenylobacterium sp.]